MGLFDTDERYSARHGEVPLSAMNKMFLLSAFALTACGGEGLTLPVTSEAPEPPTFPEEFQATWANSFTDCTLEAGWNDAAPVQITERQLIGLENICTLEAFEQNPDALEMNVTLACEGEGDVYSENAFLRLKGDTLLMQYVDRGTSVTWTRCPTQQEETDAP